MAGTVTKKMKIRLIVLISVIAVALGWVICNLFYRSIVTGQELKVKASEQQLSDLTIPANRGTIYDTNMNILAQSATVWNVQLSPLEINKYHDAAQREQIVTDLSKLLELEANDVRKRLENTGSQYEIIKRKVEKNTADAIIKLKKEKDYKGIYLEVDTKRYYPYENMASVVIGFTNSDNQGAYGLESKYNSVLSGTPGRKISAKNALGQTLPTAYEKSYPAQEGNSIVTTIDQVIQHFIEKSLDGAVSQYAPDQGAAIIVMDVNTGAILGMTSKPDFDLNAPYDIYSKKLQATIDAAKTEEEKKAATKAAWEKQWKNKTITDTYEPGSVFKTVTASAALEEGTATLHSTYLCTGSVTFPGLPKPMRCHKAGGHGRLDFTGALVNSCNPAFMTIGGGLGPTKFFKYYEAFGLTEKTGIDLPAEGKGSYYDSSMSPISLASCSFGQSNTVTPLQMMTAAVASINGGKLLQPHIVSKVVDNNGNTVQEMGTEIRRQVISKETSQIMQSALEQVVSANGGTNAYVKGYKIGGKSGTAQKLTDKTDTKRVFSYFVFAPADDPKVAALVMMDEPTEGKRDFANVVVGPLASAVMKDILPYMGIAPQYSEDELENQDLTIPSGMLGGDPFSAESKLRKKGLNGKIIGNGKTVTAIYPAQGTKIPREGTVVIYTEKDASQTVKVPNVVGVTPTQANQVLTNAGLNIKISGGAANNQRARTSAQSIEVGKEVPRGSIVEVQCLIAGEDGE